VEVNSSEETERPITGVPLPPEEVVKVQVADGVLPAAFFATTRHE